MKTSRIRDIRWVTWAGLSMAAIALAIFMTFAPSKAYAFDEGGCLCDGQFSPGKCSGGQRCWRNPSNDYCYWMDDTNCPACPD